MQYIVQGFIKGERTKNRKDVAELSGGQTTHAKDRAHNFFRLIYLLINKVTFIIQSVFILSLVLHFLASFVLFIDAPQKRIMKVW